MRALKQIGFTTHGLRRQAKLKRGEMERAKNRPVVEYKLSSIRASIWQNQTEDGDVWFKVTISRVLPAGSEQRDTTHFRRDDLPLVAKAADLAYGYIWGRDKAMVSRETEPSPSDD